MINQHWHDRNDGRLYPISDISSGVATNGDDGIIACLSDIGVTWPEELGAHLYVASFHVSKNLSSIVFGFTDDKTTASSSVVCYATATRSTRGLWVKLESSDTRVQGWVSFGSYVRDASGQFSVANAIIESTNCRPFRPIGVTSAGAEFSNISLTGIVNLAVDYPFNLKRDSVMINGILRDAIVLEITENLASSALADRPESSNIAKFVGACDRRPESGNCEGDQPIEQLGNVVPDCDGMITLNLIGCVNLTRLGESNTVLVYCPVPDIDLCPQPYVPDIEGNLPGFYDPQTFTAVDPTVTDTSTTTYTEIPSPVVFPYLECFGDEIADDFTVESGAFTFVEASSPSDADSVLCSADPGWTYSSVDTGGLNISIWDADPTTLNRSYSTDIYLNAVIIGSPLIAGIVVDYTEVSSGVYSYYLAALCFEAQEIRIYKFNGVSLVEYASAAAVLTLNNWYRLTLDVTPGTPGRVDLTASVVGLDDATDSSVGPLVTNDYYPATGKAGLYANRGVFRFAYWLAEEL